MKPEAVREFYEMDVLREGWPVRLLDRQIGSQLYERLAPGAIRPALLDKAAKLQQGDFLTPEETIRAPLALGFLKIKDACE
ncbi:YhcG family protein [Paraburkholderia youngii]|uniref:YhcG family protein n=1 Tax=Paraburkholderia youngii TaxID=2782701 RepID=UPI0015955504|nr:YhcG family protein [Paraburkholderia youngii]